MLSEKAKNLADLARSKILGGKIVSIKLSDKYNPHYAKILLQNYQNKQVIVIAELINESAENLLTYSLLHFHELEKLKTKRADKLWIIANQPQKLAGLCTNLNDKWQRKIRIFDANLTEQFAEISDVKKVKISKPPKLTKIADEIISAAPDNIQIQGSNLTFNGLPFVKFGKDKIWFGIENQRQILTPDNWCELLQLIENLILYRNFETPNKSHIFYKLLPEAWLESILRRNISQIEGNLILSPVHNQFRASAEQIDLLAIRKDGRLVIIELKVSPNREHLWQAVDYWQEIEKQRLAGNLKGLFGKLNIADEPGLVYLVAPHSCFHKDLDFLAETVSKEIEIYRFDLNETWRKHLKIMDRKKL